MCSCLYVVAMVVCYVGYVVIPCNSFFLYHSFLVISFFPFVRHSSVFLSSRRLSIIPSLFASVLPIHILHCPALLHPLSLSGHVSPFHRVFLLLFILVFFFIFLPSEQKISYPVLLSSFPLFYIFIHLHFTIFSSFLFLFSFCTHLNLFPSYIFLFSSHYFLFPHPVFSSFCLVLPCYHILLFCFISSSLIILLLPSHQNLSHTASFYPLAPPYPAAPAPSSPLSHRADKITHVNECLFPDTRETQPPFGLLTPHFSRP